MLSRYPIVMAVAAACLVLAGRRLWQLGRLIAAGQPAPERFSSWGRRLYAEVREVIGQRRLLRWTLPGLAHAFTFWGFIVLLLTIVEAFGAAFRPKFAVPGIGHLAVVGFLEDFFACAVLVSLGVFAAIRLLQDPHRIKRRSRFLGSHNVLAWLVLGMIFLVIATLLLYRAAQTNTGDFPYGWWAFASHGIGRALRPLGVGTNRVLETVFLDANLCVILAFFVLVTYSKHLHIFLAPINVAFSRQPRALGALETTPQMDFEDLAEDATFGVGVIEQFTWKQMLDFATCTECGRCQSQCPAWATGKPLSPKLVVMALRDELFAAAPRLLQKRLQSRAPTTAPSSSRAAAAQSGEDGAPLSLTPLVPNVIEPDVLWSCTTCGACVEQCPVDIEHVDAIVDMRRHQVLMESSFPSEASGMLRNIENRGDPWGLGPSKRLAWTEALDFEIPVVSDSMPEGIEYLFWIGCAGALDERAQRTTQAIARLLHRAGVGFAILGPAESCTGDPARRLGNEYLFQMQAQQNIATLGQVGVSKVIASCPHCFNSIANEYPALGGRFDVVHHSQLLARLVQEGALAKGQMDERVTYHDPCYLGRHNRVFDEPRDVLASVSGLQRVEMERCRERGFCCGAGGARMWMEEQTGTRINVNRTEEALSTGAGIVSTACPYCNIMLDDAVKAAGKADQVSVLDVAQVLERSLTAAPQASASARDTAPQGG